MSSDLTYLISDGSLVLETATMLVGIYRAIGMRRGFVDPTYRSRALWSIALMAVITVGNLTSIAPIPNDAIGTIIGFTPFLGIILVSFAFIDRTILVAIRSDFFHRNTLHWLQLRIPSFIALLASGATLFATSLVYPQYLVFGPQSGEPTWIVVVNVQFIFVTAITLTLGAAGAVMGSRRTPDKTLKRSIRILAYALLFFVMTIVVSAVLFGDLGAIVTDALSVLATYLVYLSVMSLSALGKIDKNG